MRTYLRKNNSDNLIIFFCGWGMDETPFSILKSDCDVLFVYDYKETDFPPFDFSQYKNIKQLSFSYGVYAGAIAKLPLDIHIEKSVAINGTLLPVDNTFGVPVKQFELTEKMDSQSVIKFRQRLFGGSKAEEHFNLFEQHLPRRSAQSCTEELIGMKTYVPFNIAEHKKFDKIYIANHDRCVPTRNQKNFWNNLYKNQHCPDIIELETGHFPFYNYESLDEIL